MVELFQGVMSLLMTAAFAFFVWVAVIRPRYYRGDFGDAGFQDQPKEEKPE